ncbi:MAG: glycosyltransferase family 2 protein [Candidatus Competibacteraceae bacterium]|nr:glycosyltransferase family 2 protein [Candidatus Competibacteraceae bacterium]
MISLSVVIITYNEARNIVRCIRSVQSIANEIVVIDSGSTDQTVALAVNHGARVINHPFEGHIQQKNFAVSQAISDYVLSLDADEALDDTACKAIEQCLKHWNADGYTFNRMNSYCGRFIKYGAWYPDTKLRLWDRRKGRWEGINPHDRFQMQPDTTIKHLSGHILHYSYQTVEEHRKKISIFSSIAADAYYSKGIKSNKLKILLHPFSRFIRDYFIKAGFLDGWRGFVIARLTAKEVYIKYKQLLLLQQRPKSDF